MDILDPKTLSIGPHTAVQSVVEASLPRPRRGERFLKGPIPMSWLGIAARQPGKALHVAIMLWHLAGIQRGGRVSLSLSRMDVLGIKRTSASRGLKALETAGLVSVVRHPGRRPQVTILPTDG